MFWNLFRQNCSDEMGAVEHLDCQRFPKMVDKGPSIWKTFEQQAAKWAENSCSQKTICFVLATNSSVNLFLYKLLSTLCSVMSYSPINSKSIRQSCWVI